MSKTEFNKWLKLQKEVHKQAKHIDEMVEYYRTTLKETAK